MLVTLLTALLRRQLNRLDHRLSLRQVLSAYTVATSPATHQFPDFVKTAATVSIITRKRSPFRRFCSRLSRFRAKVGFWKWSGSKLLLWARCHKWPLKLQPRETQDIPSKASLMITACVRLRPGRENRLCLSLSPTEGQLWA